MEKSTLKRLALSVANDRLVILCGAGLSMAPPSSLPSAAGVADLCYQKYRPIDPDVDPSLRYDLENLAEHISGHSSIKNFVETLVPWERFKGSSNTGHDAIADFLLTRTIVCALTSNYDCMIERSADNLGGHLWASIDGDEASSHEAKHSPLLKFHGCMVRDPVNTVWIKDQLVQEPLAKRIQKSSIWLSSKLRERDIVVVGFWSDWPYFNDLIAKALKDVSPLSFTVIDPQSIDQLKAKAPILWDICHREGIKFEHIRQSGADALDELRQEFSNIYMRRLLEISRPAFEAEKGTQYQSNVFDFPPLTSDQLYEKRRDVEGIPSGKAARQKSPGQTAETFGLLHLLLMSKGAQYTAQGYILDGKVIRLINGAGRPLNKIKDEFTAAPVNENSQIVVCVGATLPGVPANIVRSGAAGSLVRPMSQGEWISDMEARGMLSL
jgi:hypothetical protein